MPVVAAVDVDAVLALFSFIAGDVVLFACGVAVAAATAGFSVLEAAGMEACVAAGVVACIAAGLAVVAGFGVVVVAWAEAD